MNKINTFFVVLVNIIVIGFLLNLLWKEEINPSSYVFSLFKGKEITRKNQRDAYGKKVSLLNSFFLFFSFFLFSFFFFLLTWFIMFANQVS